MSRFDWRRIESASFGLLYGATMILSLLMALDFREDAPFKAAIVLFGSVLAMSLARTLAALFSHGVETRERIMNAVAFRRAWAGSHPILMTVYLPTALFIAVGFGWIGTGVGLAVSQGYCILVLAIVGARAGWVIRGGLLQPFLGAVLAGGAGSLLAAMKYAVN